MKCVVGPWNWRKYFSFELTLVTIFRVQLVLFKNICPKLRKLKYTVRKSNTIYEWFFVKSINFAMQQCTAKQTHVLKLFYKIQGKCYFRENFCLFLANRFEGVLRLFFVGFKLEKSYNLHQKAKQFWKYFPLK